jgi:hypothetical protein
MKKAIALPIPVDNPARTVSNSANDRLISKAPYNPAYKMSSTAIAVNYVFLFTSP